MIKKVKIYLANSQHITPPIHIFLQKLFDFFKQFAYL